MRKILVILLFINLIITGFCIEAEDLLTMDYSFHGQPFVDIPAKSSIDLTTMDYSFQGQPFVSFIEAEEVPATGIHIFFTLSDF